MNIWFDLLTKQRILVGLILLMTVSTAVSQSFHGGLLAGFTASQVDGDSYAGYNKAGLQAGIFVTTSFKSNFGARLEIKYTARGARNRVSEDNAEVYVLGLHYIDLPLMATLRIKKLGNLELGIVPGYLFSAAGKDAAGKLPDEFLVDFRKFDMGTLIGINIDITSKIAVNARYSYSVFSIRDLRSAGAYYSWFGQLFGHTEGDYNNYLTLGINYTIK